MNSSAPQSKVLKRLLVLSWVPFLLALAYAFWDYFSSPSDSRTAAGFVKSLGIAFFLIMWFVGQWLRTSKQISDEDQLSQLSSIKADVEAIKEAITKTATTPSPAAVPEPIEAPAAPPTSPTAVSTSIADPVAGALYSEAEAAMDAGLSNSALLSAAVAFEHSLRRFAESKNIPGAMKIPVPRLIGLLGGAVDRSVLEELSALWHVRHAIVHMRGEQLLEPQKARSLLDSFGWAMRFLSIRP